MPRGASLMKASLTRAVAARVWSRRSMAIWRWAMARRCARTGRVSASPLAWALGSWRACPARVRASPGGAVATQRPSLRKRKGAVRAPRVRRRLDGGRGGWVAAFFVRPLAGSDRPPRISWALRLVGGRAGPIALGAASERVGLCARGVLFARVSAEGETMTVDRRYGCALALLAAARALAGGSPPATIYYSSDNTVGGAGAGANTRHVFMTFPSNQAIGVAVNNGFVYATTYNPSAIWRCGLEGQAPTQ